jgi:hypothetical protein
VDGLEIGPSFRSTPLTDDADQLGNRFGRCSSSPLGMANPLERLYAHQRMRALRHSPSRCFFSLLNFPVCAPRRPRAAAADAGGARYCGVDQSPARGATLRRQRDRRQIFWVPQSGNIGMGASLFSHAGQVQFGLISDVGLVPDPERIVERFPAEFHRLERLASGRKERS